MTTEELRGIIAERLQRWTARLVAGHAAPLVLVAVGHDDQRGKILVCALEDTALSNPVLAGFLRFAVGELDPAPADAEWAVATLHQVLEHLKTHDRCPDCRAYLRGHGR